jgi:hypothetical protein
MDADWPIPIPPLITTEPVVDDAEFVLLTTKILSALNPSPLDNIKLRFIAIIKSS